MIELVDLSNWKKQKDILDELYKNYNINISSRTWRSKVEKWNRDWGEGKVDYCITHSPNYGFKATSKFEDVLIGIKDYESRIKKMYLTKRNLLQGFIKRYNLKIDFKTGEIV